MGPSTKKRKLDDNGVKVNGHTQSAEDSSMDGSWTTAPIEGISFSVPQRKKLLLQISPKKNEGIRALNPGTKQKEFGIPWKQIGRVSLSVHPRRAIAAANSCPEHVLCLPVPEKAQAARNFCVFPKLGDGIPRPPGETSEYEPMVWTAPDVPAKEADDEQPSQSAAMIKAIEQAGFNVQQPSEKDFASQVIQGYRKGEKAYHVKAFRGSKDGAYASCSPLPYAC